MVKSMKEVKTFYKDSKWEHKRKRILRRDGYKCQDAKRYGRYQEAITVHHIYPVEEYPELAYTDWNLISLSNESHNKMHDRTTGKITDYGMYWQKKRRKEFEEWKERREGEEKK